MIRYRTISALPLAMIFGWALMGTTFPGCGSVSPSAQKEIQDQQSRLTRKWVLVEMIQDSGDVNVPPDVATLEFSIDHYHGTGGCNSCGGDYAVSANGKIHIGAGAWTEMACEDDRLMDFENRFSAMLGRITNFTVSDAELQLSDGSDRNRLILKPYQSPPPLDVQETLWSLELFEECDEIAVSATQVISGSQITLSIRDGIVEGFGGVSPYQGSVEISNGSIKLNATAANRRSASEELNKQQEYYLEILNSATRLQVDSLHLQISNATGTQSLIFTPSSNEEFESKR